MTPREKFLERRDRFSIFYLECLDLDRRLVGSGRENQGHGFEHDLLVAQYGSIIAAVHYNEKVADMAWIAGLLHSSDRHFRSHAEARNYLEAMLLLLPEGVFTLDEFSEIEQAVKAHASPNLSNDSPTKICLQDADRLAGIGPMTFIRSGQFLPRKPLIQTSFSRLQRAPASSYRNPASCHDDILGTLEWEKDPQFGLRLEESKRLAKPHFKATYQALLSMYGQFQETGLEE